MPNSIKLFITVSLITIGCAVINNVFFASIKGETLLSIISAFGIFGMIISFFAVLLEIFNKY